MLFGIFEWIDRSFCQTVFPEISQISIASRFELPAIRKVPFDGFGNMLNVFFGAGSERDVMISAVFSIVDV